MIEFTYVQSGPRRAASLISESPVDHSEALGPGTPVGIPPGIMTRIACGCYRIYREVQLTLKLTHTISRVHSTRVEPAAYVD